MSWSDNKEWQKTLIGNCNWSSCNWDSGVTNFRWFKIKWSCLKNLIWDLSNVKTRIDTWKRCWQQYIMARLLLLLLLVLLILHVGSHRIIWIFKHFNPWSLSFIERRLVALTKNPALELSAIHQSFQIARRNWQRMIRHYVLYETSLAVFVDGDMLEEIVTQLTRKVKYSFDGRIRQDCRWSYTSSKALKGWRKMYKSPSR